VLIVSMPGSGLPRKRGVPGLVARAGRADRAAFDVVASRRRRTARPLPGPRRAGGRRSTVGRERGRGRWPRGDERPHPHTVRHVRPPARSWPIPRRRTAPVAAVAGLRRNSPNAKRSRCAQPWMWSSSPSMARRTSKAARCSRASEVSRYRCRGCRLPTAGSSDVSSRPRSASLTWPGSGTGNGMSAALGSQVVAPPWYLLWECPDGDARAVELHVRR